MKKISLMIAALMVGTTMLAVPAKRIYRTVTLSDGTKVQASMRGDESFHFLETIDGRPLSKLADGTFCYADKESVVKTWTESTARRNKHRQALAKKYRAMVQAESKSRAGRSTTGNKKGLVILVNFKDKKMKHTQEEFDAQFNEEGYNVNRHIGSVRDYFRAQSYGKLTIDFDVVGPYDLDNDMKYYGRTAYFKINNNGTLSFAGFTQPAGYNETKYLKEDANPYEMIYNACKMADPDVNFKDYDWDGDGEVDQVFVVYAGFGEASDDGTGSLENTIWPHEYQLQYASDYPDMTGYPDFAQFSYLKLDGVRIDTYACGNELIGTSGSQMDGIGTACHEFSHCLGLPDMYDTTYNSFGMGAWDLLDAGCYGGPSERYFGSVPAAYTAYERWYSGWMEPVELSEGRNISGMKPITEEPEAYVIYNQANKNEYYLLENRQKVGFDKYLYGHGMLVLHVDFSQSAWDNNEVNNEYNHQRCSIVAADNSYVLYDESGMSYFDKNDLAGDPYPGKKNNHALTDTSRPAATLFNRNSDGRKYLGKPIEEIQESEDGTISFVFNGGGPSVVIEPPVAEEPQTSELGDGSFVASWSEIENAVSYTIELQEKKTEELNELAEEDFAKLKDLSNTSRDISTTIDSYMNSEGWTGKKLYSGVENGLKFGSSTVGGKLISPKFKSETGSATIQFEINKFDTDDINVKLTIAQADGKVLQQQVLTEEGIHTIVVNDIADLFNVTIESGKSINCRFYLAGIKVIDGYNEELPAVIIQDVTDTSYIFSDLTGEAYTYRVKVVTQDGESEWSNTVEVDMSQFSTGVERLTINNEQLTIYDLTGRRIVNHKLQKGIYILNGKKVFVK